MNAVSAGSEPELIARKERITRAPRVLREAWALPYGDDPAPEHERPIAMEER